MFESVLDGEAPDAGALPEEDWFDPAWLEQIPAPEDVGQVPASQCAPSGWLALELDQGTVDPARLSDADLIETMIGFERVSSWAQARQARLVAEFARRRPGQDPLPASCSDKPCRGSELAADEVALALRLSRTTAANRLVMAQTLVTDLPGTLAAWQAGVIDGLKARAITEASYLLAAQQRAELEARVLARAGTQTVARLRAALARAVLAIDPQGAAARYEQRRHDRRVVLGPDEEGMATLWALLSAPDATAAYQRLGELARGLGASDPRGMDARRADLLADLLTGRRCAATGECLDPDCDDPHHEPAEPEPEPAEPEPAEPEPAEAEPGEAVATPTPTSTPHTPTRPPAGDRGHPTGQGGHPCAPRPGRPGKPLISVIVPVTTLMGLDEQPGELVGYGPIPAPLAREIAAGGTWRRLLTDPESGTLLDCGRTTYTPPAGLADFVRARDVYCRNPICGQRAATADLDHTVPYPDGPTSQHNLYAACRHDHRVKTHAPGWHVGQHPDGRITWTTPTGHSYTSHPHDYRPNPPPPPPGAGRCDSIPPDDDPPPF